jgi:pimeloyl-ACP methyl ester carboxylesterase
MALNSGTKLGPYEIRSHVGVGGMGEVYRCLDTRHHRFVAVKVLRQDVSSLVGAERFLREIRIAAQLTHPHILPLVDSGEADGVLFYVMPYIEGETLRNRLSRESELPVSEITRILHQITDALAYAHAHGVVHRDIKPENILLSDRHALLADFGVAKALSDLSRSGSTATTNLVTAIGSTVGTPTYMAPEQVGGNLVDHRADLYGVGVVAYEMIGGRLPFQTSSAQQMMAAHLTQAPDPITKWRPAISVRLANAVMKCLEKKAADRWQSAADLLSEIEAAGTEIKTLATVEIANELTEHRFTLSERVCRKLNRETLDPRIIGDHLSYVDNQVRSDVLVFFLHGLGLDHADFESILQRLKYRGVSPTLYGCEPERRGRISLSLADHVVILREWLKDVRARFHAEAVVMVGYSMGADMGFELLLGPTDEPTSRIDAFLSLESNLSLDTCFVSRLLAGIDPTHPELSIAKLRGLSDSAASLDEWLNVEEYLVKILRKFQGDIGVLQRTAADIVRLFSETQGFEVFARWFRGARERVRAMRVVFSSDPRTRAALARLKLDNLDKGILGGEFPEDIITVSENADHFRLMATEHVVRQVDELVAEARAASAQRSPLTSGSAAQ